MVCSLTSERFIPNLYRLPVHSIVGSSSFAPVYSYDNSVAGQYVIREDLGLVLTSFLR